MLAKKTCLLLGAGASSHLGYPLGAQLQDQMVAELREPEKILSVIDGLSGSNVSDLRNFYSELAFGDWKSPDEFLTKRPRFGVLGKRLIVTLLAKCEDPHALAVRAGWYRRLRTAIGANTLKDFQKNRLSIVTFNYDRSIEFFLHRFVQVQFQLDYNAAWSVVKETIPIVHVHGMLAEYPVRGYGTEHVLPLHSRDIPIKIVSEVEDNSADFALASKLLHEAEKVVVFGFGFGEDNVRRLKFFEEGESERRDVTIAIGHARGDAHRKATEDSLARWGLLPKKHLWHIPVDQLFDNYVDPFA